MEKNVKERLNCKILEFYLQQEDLGNWIGPMTLEIRDNIQTNPSSKKTVDRPSNNPLSSEGQTLTFDWLDGRTRVGIRGPKAVA